jgi:hypothetical protein
MAGPTHSERVDRGDKEARLLPRAGSNPQGIKSSFPARIIAQSFRSQGSDPQDIYRDQTMGENSEAV